MESQDSSQETQPEVPEPENARPARDKIAQLIPLHPTADYVDLVTVPFTFGRLKSSNFTINDKRISATHCIFTKRGDHIHIEDKSTNGTYINQKILGRGNTMKLKTGDIVAFVEKDGFGTFSYVFYDVCAPPATADKVFKEYLVECVLGNGNFGVVQRVKRISTGEFFAMKVIDKMKLAASCNKMDENNTLMEVHILKILRHPNIIAVVEVCDTPRYVYLILELADQGELFEKIFNQGCYSEREGKQVFRQILDAIAYLHDMNIAHRDLKPENILLHNQNGESVVKVSDFGLAKILGEFQSTRTLCGTPMYVAPEMLAHSRFLQGDKTVASEAKNGYGKEVDVWSLGCILYIILSGRPPFNDPIPKDLFERIAAGDYEMTEEPWQRISSEAKDLISKLLIVAPAKRLTVRGALAHKWFDELSDKPLHTKPEKLEKSSRSEQADEFDIRDKLDQPDKSNKSKPDRPDKPDEFDKSGVLDTSDPEVPVPDTTRNRKNDNESYRTSIKPQTRQNSADIENVENTKRNNERRSGDTPRHADSEDQHGENNHKEVNNNNNNNNNNNTMDRNKERGSSKNRTDNKRESFKESSHDKTSGGTDNHKAESKKADGSERASHEGSVVKTMERHSRGSRDAADYSANRIESRTESRTSRTNDKDHSHSHRHHKPNEIEPMTTSNSSKSPSHHDSKNGKRDTKSVHSFVLPTTPSTKSSPHKSPRKNTWDKPMTPQVNTRKLEFTKVPPTPLTPPDKSKRTSSSFKDSPVVGYIDKQDKERHSSKRLPPSSQRPKLDFDKPTPKPHSASLVAGLGSSDDEAKKRKLPLPSKGDNLVVIEDDKSHSSRTGKKQKEF